MLAHDRLARRPTKYKALVYYDFCFPDSEEIQLELDEIRLACLLNSAACFLRCNELDQVLDCCYQVWYAIPHDKSRVKGGWT